MQPTDLLPSGFAVLVMAHCYDTYKARQMGPQWLFCNLACRSLLLSESQVCRDAQGHHTIICSTSNVSTMSTQAAHRLKSIEADLTHFLLGLGFEYRGW